MTQVQISLPDQLAAEAQSAGLLNPERVEAWLREQLGKQHRNKLFAAVHRAIAVPNPPPMSSEELASEIAAARAEQRVETGH